MLILMDCCAMAQSGDGELVQKVSVGFSNQYKVGYWTPVRITLQAGGAGPLNCRLAVTTADSDGAIVRFPFQDSISLPAGESKTFVGRVKFGELRPSAEVELQIEGGQVVRRPLTREELPDATLTDSELLLTLGDSIGEEDWIATQVDATRSVKRCQFETSAELPEDWLAYEGVDVVILTTANNRALEEMSPGQLAALRQWILMGGRLVLTVGARGKELFGSSEDSNLGRLAEFVPGTFVDLGLMSSVIPLENYTGSTHPLDVPDDERLRVTVLKDVQGVVELSDTGRLGVQPLVVQSAFGLGQVTFVALDLNVEPLASWPGRPQAVARLLRGGTKTTEKAGGSQLGGRVAHVGFTDITGQLRSALDQFAGVSLVPFYWVAGLVFVYTLLIGPGDFFFLQRILRRMQLTWITFPLIVCSFCAVAVFLHGQFKSPQLHVNQLELVDIDLATSTVRGSTWVDIYSPKTAVYDIGWKVASNTQPLLTGGQAVGSWQGLPGGGLGGLSSSTAMPTFRATYDVAQTGPAAELLGLPIQAASTKAVQLRWWGQTTLTSGSQLEEDSNRLLRGKIENPLPFDLTDCTILFGQWMYRLPDRMSGKLAAGESIQIESDKPRNLEYVLTRPRRGEDSRDVATPWDQNDLDVPRILQMMMFHQAAGGENYTQLRHRYQAFLDLSQHLQRGRAILVGRAAEPAMDLEVNANAADEAFDRTWSFYRVVFPVVQSENP